jgi:nicotinate-nucleotide adenylyltransferase
MFENTIEKMKKIGIMGGTFNPIHIGHLLMAQWAKEAADLDAILFIPAGNPYMKSGTGVLDGSLRLEMVRLSIEKEDSFFCSDIEIKRSGNTYTYETLQELKTLYPDAVLYFIVGADSLYSFERWVHPESILENCVLMAAARNGAKMDELDQKRVELMERFGGEIRLFDFPSIDISSTMVRERVAEGKSIRYLVTDQVSDFIAKQGLYL